MAPGEFVEGSHQKPGQSDSHQTMKDDVEATHQDSSMNSPEATHQETSMDSQPNFANRRLDEGDKDAGEEAELPEVMEDAHEEEPDSDGEGEEAEHEEEPEVEDDSEVMEDAEDLDDEVDGQVDSDEMDGQEDEEAHQTSTEATTTPEVVP